VSLKTIRRLAASVAGVGESRVRIIDAKRAGEALTRDDVRSLFAEGAVALAPRAGVGRAKARFKHFRLQAGRRRGRGSRKGGVGSRSKQKWISLVRGLRKLLALRKGKMNSGDYRKAYRMIKGGFFKNKRQLAEFLRQSEKR
jgi:large subunit ribosomal protein L19e